MLYYCEARREHNIVIVLRLKLDSAREFANHLGMRATENPKPLSACPVFAPSHSQTAENNNKQARDPEMLLVRVNRSSNYS